MTSIVMWIDAWAAWMVPMLWQGSAAIVLVAAVDRALERHGWPQLLTALWWVVLLRFLLPPWFGAGLGSWLRSPAVSTQVEPLGATQSAVLRYGFAVWLVGMIVLVAMGGVRHRVVLRRWARQKIKTTPEIRACVRAGAAQLGLRRVPSVWVVRELGGARVGGLWRPRIYLPASLVRASPDALEPIVHHELAHLRRGDLWAQALWAAVHRVYWFHPLFAFARRRAEVVRELGCDALVMRSLGPGRMREYRRLLVRAAAQAHGLVPTGAGAFASLVGGRSAVLRRLRWLETERFRNDRPRWWLTATLAAGLSVVVLPLAAVSTSSQDRSTLPAVTQQAIDAAIAGESSMLRRYAVMYLHAQQAELAGTSSSLTKGNRP